MDIIDAIYDREIQSRSNAHQTYMFQSQQGIVNDPYITENAWKCEVYMWLKDTGKRIMDITLEDLQKRVLELSSLDMREKFCWAMALILSDFYGIPMRIVYDHDAYEGVNEDHWTIMKRYGRAGDAYYKYQIQEQGELDAQGRTKQLEPVKNNDINNIDIDTTQIEITEWKKILSRLEQMLEKEIDDNKKLQLEDDISKAKNNLERLTSNK